MATKKVPTLENYQFQPSVKDKDLSAPPAATKGHRYIVAATGSGDWTGHTGDIAIGNGSGWDFVTKAEGLITWVEDENLYYYFDGSNWIVSNPFNKTISGEIIGLTDKPTPLDADVALIESVADTNAKRKLTWLNIKNTLKTYFDGIYKATFAYTAEDVANKENTTIDTSTTKYPTVNLLKTGIDARVKNDGTVNPTNLLLNGDFENWSAGTSVAPDGWTLVLGGSVARESSIVKRGTYSCKMISDADGNYLTQELNTQSWFVYSKGRKYTFSCQVYASDASSARISVDDNISNYYSSYHTGGSTWELLSVTFTVNASAGNFLITFRNEGNTKTAYFDGAMCVEGESIFAFCEKPLSVDKLSDTFKNINPTNLLSNGDFENWSAGTTVAPDGWDKGTNTTIAREATTIKIGTYSAKLTNLISDISYIEQANIATPKGIAYWKGRTVTFSCWIYATVASRVKLRIDDGITSSYSTAHTGDSTWQLLTLTKTLSGSAAKLELLIGDLTAGSIHSFYVDGAMLVEGESTFAFSERITPIPLGTAAAVLTANKGPAGCTAVTGWIAINIAGVQRFIPYW